MSKILDFDQLYPNRFLKAGELAGKEATLEITGVELEELEGEKGKKARGILSFKETKKQLVLNRTNGECIKAMFGRSVPAWTGKRITICPVNIDAGFSDEPMLAIRVRGSPDIAGDLTVQARIGRKTGTFKLVQTGGKPSAKKPELVAQQTEGEPPPMSDEEKAQIEAQESGLAS